MSECVKVVTRSRPMSKKEIEIGSKSCIEVDLKSNSTTIVHPSENDNKKTFTFDFVFDGNSKQKDVYDRCAFPLVENCIEG